MIVGEMTGTTYSSGCKPFTPRAIAVSTRVDGQNLPGQMRVCVAAKAIVGSMLGKPWEEVDEVLLRFRDVIVMLDPSWT